MAVVAAAASVVAYPLRRLSLTVGTSHSCKSGTPDPSNIWPALYVASWTRSPDRRSIVLHRSVRAAKQAAPARDLGKQPSLGRRPAPP